MAWSFFVEIIVIESMELAIAASIRCRTYGSVRTDGRNVLGEIPDCSVPTKAGSYLGDSCACGSSCSMIRIVVACALNNLEYER